MLLFPFLRCTDLPCLLQPRKTMDIARTPFSRLRHPKRSEPIAMNVLVPIKTVLNMYRRTSMGGTIDNGTKGTEELSQ